MIENFSGDRFISFFSGRLPLLLLYSYGYGRYCSRMEPILGETSLPFFLSFPFGGFFSFPSACLSCAWLQSVHQWDTSLKHSCSFIFSYTTKIILPFHSGCQCYSVLVSSFAEPFPPLAFLLLWRFALVAFRIACSLWKATLTLSSSSVEGSTKGLIPISVLRIVLPEFSNDLYAA